MLADLPDRHAGAPRHLYGAASTSSTRVTGCWRAWAAISTESQGCCRRSDDYSWRTVSFTLLSKQGGIAGLVWQRRHALWRRSDNTFRPGVSARLEPSGDPGSEACSNRERGERVMALVWAVGAEEPRTR